MIRASFSFAVPYDAESRLLSNALAGGGILDVGCYPVTAANLLAGWAPAQFVKVIPRDYKRALQTQARAEAERRAVETNPVLAVANG